MTKELHLYISVAENETIEQATTRTNETIENLFSGYGFTLLEQWENEATDYPEIKTFLNVDTNKNQLETVLVGFEYQIY